MLFGLFASCKQSVMKGHKLPFHPQEKKIASRELGGSLVGPCHDVPTAPRKEAVAVYVWADLGSAVFRPPKIGPNFKPTSLDAPRE